MGEPPPHNLDLDLDRDRAGQPLDAELRYKVHEPLAAGGMAVVHLGTLMSSAGERRVAIKRLGPAMSDDAEAMDRISAEARLVFQLTHANICQVLDLGTNDEGTFIVMEYVRGLDFSSLLKKIQALGKTLDVPNALHVAREVARALDYAHRFVDNRGQALSLVHGDVKPANILLSVEGEVKLADFGIARTLESVGPGNELRGGTPGFLAPEAATTIPDHRADIYALGKTLLAALRQQDDLGANLTSIIARATATDPAQRFLSAQELERALALELARRCPDFTPSRLADVVRLYAPTPRGESEPGTFTTIASIRSQTKATVSSDGGIDPFAAAPQTHSHNTRTLSAPPKRFRKWRAVAGALIAVALVGAFAVWRSAKPAPVAPVAMSQPNIPPAAVTLPAEQKIDVEAKPTHHKVAAPINKTPQGYLTVSADPWGVLYVDGRKLADETPVYRLPLAAGRHQVTIMFEARGKQTAARAVMISPGETQTLGFRR